MEIREISEQPTLAEGRNCRRPAGQPLSIGIRRVRLQQERDWGWVLRPALLGGDGFARRFPGTLGAVGLRLVAILDAIVVVGFAHRAQRFVVEAGQAECLLQFLGKLMQSLQVIGSGRNFVLRRLQELLVAAVDELGNLAANQVTGVRENLYPVPAVFLDCRRNVVLLQEDTASRTRRLNQIKAVLAQPAYGFVISALLQLGRHLSNKSFLCSCWFRCANR